MESSAVKQDQFEVELISFNRLKGNVFGKTGNSVENITITFTEKKNNPKQQEAVIEEKPASMFSLKPKETSGFMTGDSSKGVGKGSSFLKGFSFSFTNPFTAKKKQDSDIELEAETHEEGQETKKSFFSIKNFNVFKGKKQKEGRMGDMAKSTALPVEEKEEKHDRKVLQYFASAFQRNLFLLIVICIIILGAVALLVPVNNGGKEETVAEVIWESGVKNMGEGGQIRETVKNYWNSGTEKICEKNGIGENIWKEGTEKLCGALDVGLENGDGNGQVVYADLGIRRVIDSGTIPLVNQDVPGQPAMPAELNRAELISRIRKASQAMLIGRVYFFKVINKDQHEVGFTELSNILGIKLLSGKEKEVVAYRLMVYLEGKDRLRLGLLAVFDRERMPTMANLEIWEKTITSDLKQLYLDNDQDAVNMAGKSFKSSSISRERRYVNFNNDQSLSLDYALASDGIIIVTSKGFGTAALSKILENEAR